MKLDVLVAGAGPAGIAVAAECASRGLAVGLLAPDPDAPWAPTYCSWADELDPAVPVDARWDDIVVRPTPGTTRRAGPGWAWCRTCRCSARSSSA